MNYSKHSFNDFGGPRLASHNDDDPFASPGRVFGVPFPTPSKFILGPSRSINSAQRFAFSPFSDHSSGSKLFMPTPIARPLFLADNLQASTFEFQTNSILDIRTSSATIAKPEKKSIRTRKAGESNGYGLGLIMEDIVSDDLFSSGLTCDTQYSSLPCSSSPTQTIPGLFDDSLKYLKLLESPSERKEPLPSHTVLKYSSVATSASSTSLEDHMFSDSTSNSSSLHSLSENSLSRSCLRTSAPNKHCSPSLPGLVADINMFDRSDCEAVTFVRPQDLMGRSMLPADSYGPRVTMDVDSQTELSPRLAYPYPPQPHLPIHTSLDQPEWPLLTTEQLSEVVDYFFLHIKPQSQSVKAESHSREQVPLFLPDPTTTWDARDTQVSPTPARVKLENLSLLEQHVFSCDPQNSEVKLDVKATNVRRPAVNILEVYDTLPACDILVEKAHEGVSQATVAQKTKYFKMMHPGEKLADDLLFTFAGRFSSSGAPIPGYRCYVDGCVKVTKRKDHMGDHIRTHLGEKPFQCSIW